MFPECDIASTREDLIRHYFRSSFTNKEIVNALFIHHAIRLSVRHLKRLLHNMGLRRVAVQESSRDEVIAAISTELKGSGQCLGYRAMWKRLKMQYNLEVKRDTVLQMLWELDPEGVTRRKTKQMKRRKYACPGPNHTWHIDGYDKIKPFSFCIHGAIDGYSRKILWLEVGPSNNDPGIIAHYYIKCVKHLEVAPRILRTDLGTENTTVAFLQPFLRSSGTDEFSGPKSFMYGQSTSNQRIEALWSILRRSNMDWWITFFKDMRDSGDFVDCNIFHREAMQFCFLNIIRSELRKFTEEWNSHVITSKRNTECVKGKPNVMFHMPEMYNTTSYGQVVTNEDVLYCQRNHTTQPNETGCSPEFLELLDLLKPGVEKPTSAIDGLELYKQICQLISSYSD